jgi:hypothetical protein
MNTWRLAAKYFLVIFTIVILSGCSPKAENRVITLTFDGETCRFAGPNAITQGDVTIILNNQSEYELSLWAAKLNENKTWQDMLEYIGSPGSSVELPSWAEWRVMASKVPDNPDATVYTLTKGLYAINCCTCGEVKGPRGVWPGATLEVIEK